MSSNGTSLGSFLSFENSSSSSLPSLFELIMQDRMSSGVKPAVRYFVQAVCDAYPTPTNLALHQRFHETFAVLQFLYERYCLQKYNSLLTEHFYGIKRMVSSSPPSPLNSTDRAKSLFFTVAVPYWKCKLDDYFNSLSESDLVVPDAPPPCWKNIGNVKELVTMLKLFPYRLALRRVFHSIYPLFHLSYDGLFFAYQWLYLFGYTPYFSPFLHYMKIIMARVTPDDLSKFQENQKSFRRRALAHLSKENNKSSQLYLKFRRFLLRSSWSILDNSHFVLFGGIVCFKFVEWIYFTNSTTSTPVNNRIRNLYRNKINSQLSPPPPPNRPSCSNSKVSLPGNCDICPICSKIRSNAAASISGYVFCYPCIFRYVSEYGECPISRQSCQTNSIIRIYEEGGSSSNSKIRNS